MAEPQNSTPTFNVGITMAGAGSAGCYTGGAMDYLFEILDLWEKAKQKNLPGYEKFYSLIPPHNVVIDAMGGTSAGGMTTCMSAVYALKGEINPVTDPGVTGVKRDNIFYDSWVMLDDDLESDGEKTLFKAFNSDDLQQNKFLSLLNSKIIDDIADNALHVEGDLERQVTSLPPYISKDLDILQVHTMLRGIPLGINFSTPIGEVKGVSDLPSYNSFEHFMVSHYKLNYGNKPDTDQFLWFNPYEKPYSDTMSLTTKATGAFPIGLKFRDIDQNTFTDNYLKCATERTIFNRFSEKKERHKIDWSNFPVNFNFVTIDGGAINNEPFGEVLGILKSRYNECFENGYPKYGVVMIDPFPDEVDQKKIYKAPDDLFSVVPAIIATLHDQSKVKRDDIIEAAENPYFRGEIFPRKWINREKDEFPITTGSVSAFGGFLDIQFRHYDFFLGRDNARNYFRYYFSFEYFRDDEHPEKNIIHPIHRSWDQDMIDVFKVTGKDGKTYLPIVPDLNILQETKLTGGKRDPYKYSIDEKPKYDPKQFFLIRQQMKNRFTKILEIAKRKAREKNNQTKNIETDKWMDKFYHKSWWDKMIGHIINGAINAIFYVTKRGLARNITEVAAKWVLADLEKKQMLEKCD